MSGSLAVIAAAAGGQQPMLVSLHLTDLTAGQAGFIVRFYRDGRLKVATAGGVVITDYFPMWAGGGAIATVGDAYQVRATVITNNVWNTDFNLPDIWYTLNAAAPNAAATYSTFPAPSGTAVVKFEIRRLAGSIVVASATWTLDWTS